MTEKEESISSDFARLHPFEIRSIYEYVKENTALYDRRISAMTDLFHGLQLSFKEQDTFLRTKLTDIEGRYVNGTSRTLQDVKTQNAELEKAMVRIEGLLKENANSIDKRVSLLAQDSAHEFETIASKFEGYDSMKKEFRDFAWKLLFWASTGILGAVASLFFYIYSVKNQIEQIPAVIAYQQAMQAASPRTRR